MTTAFDNDKYIRIQSENIRERIGKFDNKLYLELGGKLFDDLHASRVLPGFMPDSKLQMLTQLQDSLEILIVLSAEDIERNKVRQVVGKVDLIQSVGSVPLLHEIEKEAAKQGIVQNILLEVNIGR